MCSNTWSQNAKACMSFSHIVHTKENWLSSGDALVYFAHICIDYFFFSLIIFPKCQAIYHWAWCFCRLWLCQPQRCVRRVVYVPVASKACALSSNTSPAVAQLGECLNETLSVPVNMAEAKFLQLHRWKCFSLMRKSHINHQHVPRYHDWMINTVSRTSCLSKSQISAIILSPCNFKTELKMYRNYSIRELFRLQVYSIRDTWIQIYIFLKLKWILKELHYCFCPCFCLLKSTGRTNLN